MGCPSLTRLDDGFVLLEVVCANLACIGKV